MSETLFERALAWIDRRLEDFDPVREPATFDFSRGQRLGELAILARTAVRVAGRSDDPRVGRMAALLQKTQSSPVYADRLFRAPIEFMLFLEGYAALRALGADDERMRARLQKAIRGGWLNQTERFPHRAMDIRSCLDACRIDCDLPPLDELYRRSILGTPPNPILLNEHDLYALTHVVMFLCDFGARQADAMPAHHRDEVAALLSALTVVAARDRHWDLLAEFLLCWSCLDLPETALIAHAWEALARAQRADGAVPGPEAAQLNAAEPPFEHVYHTTLVSALAAGIRQGKARDLAPAGRAPIAPHVMPCGGEPELSQVAQHAGGWLMRSAETELARETRSALRLSQVLVGLACCSALSGERPAEGLVQRIVACLGDVEAAQWASVPPLLQCVSAAWAADAAVFVPALHGAGSLPCRAAAFLRHAPPLTRGQQIAMHESWSALHALGIAPAPLAVSSDELRRHGREIALDSDRGHLDDLLRALDAATVGGTRRIELPEECAWLAGLIAGLAVDACRRYDLGGACDLIRTGLATMPQDPCAARLFRLAVDYLIFNQREDGAFGFCGPEMGIRGQQPTGAIADDLCRERTPTDTGHLLPLTVTCLMTLAACFRGWHVQTALGARAAALGAMLAARTSSAAVDAQAIAV